METADHVGDGRAGETMLYYDGLEENPRPAAGGGSFEICPSCGFQFGVTDDDRGIAYDDWREEWIQAGMAWDKGRSQAPAHWDPAKQLARLGIQVRK